MSQDSGDARRRTILRQAVVPQVLQSVYLQFIEWISLPPSNDLSRGNGQPLLDAVLGVAFVGLLIGTIRRNKFAIVTTCVGLAVWLWLQLQTSWIPYVTGGSAGWRRTYANWFAGITDFCPNGATIRFVSVRTLC